GSSGSAVTANPRGSVRATRRAGAAAPAVAADATCAADPSALTRAIVDSRDPVRAGESGRAAPAGAAVTTGAAPALRGPRRPGAVESALPTAAARATVATVAARCRRVRPVAAVGPAPAVAADATGPGRTIRARLP